MMKKLYFELHNNKYWIVLLNKDEVSGYYIMQTKNTKLGMTTEKFFLLRSLFDNSALELLNLCLNFDHIDDLELVEIETITRENKVCIYSSESIKKQEYKEFDSLDEAIAYDEAYNQYDDKRWEEMPKIKVSTEDWELIQQQWKEVTSKYPKYIMFTLDDSGPLDKVEIIGKNELSQENVEYIQKEHEKYVKYEKARQKYIENHPDYSEVWRGPQDDEYEADIMKYYEDSAI